MPSPPIAKFCWCTTLEVGGMVIGGLQIGYYVITLIGAIIMLGMMQDLQDAFVELAKEEGADHRPYESIVQIASGILWPIIIFRIIGIVTSICLILGSMKRNKALLLPYMIFEGIGFVLLVLLWFLMVPGRGTTVDGFVVFLFVTVYIVVNKYFWMCVLSLYLLITNEQRQQLTNGDVMIPLQTIPENQRMYMPANNAYPPQQQPLYIPQPVNAYPQQQIYPGQHPPAYPVQTYHQPLPEKV